MLGLFAAELGEDAEGVLGVQEANLQAFGTGAALLVDQADTLLLGIVQGLVGVLHSEGDVVHATFTAVLLNKTCDGAFGAGGFEKLNLDVAAAEERGLHFLVGDLFDGVAFQSHNVLPVADGFLKVRYSDADVFNV